MELIFRHEIPEWQSRINNILRTRALFAVPLKTKIMSEKQLPSIQELYSDKPEKEKENNLNVILNQPPKKEWIKQHPQNKSVQYIPVERIEYLLTRIYQKWCTEVKEIKLIGNSVNAIVRLWVRNPLTGEWEYQEGTGAQPLQTEKDVGATDFNKLKTNAVQLASPSAVSYAEKNAAARLGKIFGKDLNREDINYNSLMNRFEKPEKEKVKNEIIAKLDELEKSQHDVSKWRKELKIADKNGQGVDYFQNVLGRLQNEYNV